MSDLVMKLREEQVAQQITGILSTTTALGAAFCVGASYFLHSAYEDIRELTTIGGGRLPMPQQLYSCVSYLYGGVSTAFVLCAVYYALKMRAHEKNVRSLELKIISLPQSSRM